MIYCHLGIWVAKWSIFGATGKETEGGVRPQMASRAKQSWYLGTSLADILASWHQLVLVSWHQLGHLGTSLADILASWHQLSCLIAFLVILGTKISIFWWLWHHENIAA